MCSERQVRREPPYPLMWAYATNSLPLPQPLPLMLERSMQMWGITLFATMTTGICKDDPMCQKPTMFPTVALPTQV